MNEPTTLDKFVLKRTFVGVILSSIPFIILYFFIPWEYGMTLWEIDYLGFELGEIERQQRLSNWNNYFPTIAVFIIQFFMGVITSFTKDKDPGYLGSGILVFLGWLIYSSPWNVILFLCFSNLPLIIVWSILKGDKNRKIEIERLEKKRLKKEKKKLKKQRKKYESEDLIDN